ncbi:MAG TPA: ABC transporter ATP-binding protein [Oscillatoriales cyanobacterium M59_W2019_021]|nr:MAG: ABC transporter ATP-binding protein [Cyanobacteria bacterium J055]HIK33533.1 ABC transporter ATP-binding protein [Oscillatoriales cyanobacterium M4454_W2019_049]HIK53209.1 ABC transporter ATP-binding protein [Oscillatoriales cyanobacterium M59_W2019_021]
MIEVEQLSKIYGTTQAIRDVTFNVEKGEILGFLGPNGAGKTTTMQILAGFLPATSGTARIAGYDVHEQSMAVRQRIGYLPETPPLYPDMTVEGFLHFVARIKGVAAGDRSKRVDLAVARCGLSERRKTLIRKLSKGFRQRVGIAQAIVHDPPVIILDEPTVGLDPRQIIEVRNLIKSLAGEHTIVLSTHILPEVNMTCSQVAIIKRGQVVATDKIENLMGRLTGGMGYEVEVEADVAGLEASLGSLFENIPGVKSIELLSREHLPENRYKWRMTAEPGTEPGRIIASRVVKAGLGLCELHRVQASLEDVFLELTMEDAKTPETEAEADVRDIQTPEPDMQDSEPPENTPPE